MPDEPSPESGVLTNYLAHHFTALLHLRAIVEAGSIGRAAKRQGISQPALTRAIARLEAAAGIRLLNRSPRGVVPTEAGIELLAHIAVVKGELGRAAITLSALRGALQGAVNCGAGGVPMAFLVPEAASRLQRKLPRLQITLVEGSTDSLLKMLKNGLIDVAISLRMEGQQDPAFDTSLLIEDHIAVFARHGHPALASDDNLAALLERYCWVIPSEPAELYASIVTDLSRQQSSLPSRLIQANSATAARKLVEDADYLALTSGLVFSEQLKSGSIHEVRGTWSFAATETVVFTRAGEPLAPAVAKFVDSLHATVTAG